MYVLVDYDNASPDQRALGGAAFVRSIAERVCAVLPNLPDRLRFRLYGGWYDDVGLTQHAQSIVIDIDASLPDPFFRPITTAAGQPARLQRSLLQAELAYSMLTDPGRHLLHTARQEKMRTLTKVVKSRRAGCIQEPCCLSGLYGLIRSGRCPANGCQISSDDLLPGRVNQKLVDTMLAADLLFLSGEGEPTVILASSDDDFIPPVLQAVMAGTRVYHLHLMPRTTPAHYLPNASAPYVQLAY